MKDVNELLTPAHCIRLLNEMRIKKMVQKKYGGIYGGSEGIRAQTLRRKSSGLIIITVAAADSSAQSAIQRDDNNTRMLLPMYVCVSCKQECACEQNPYVLMMQKC